MNIDLRPSTRRMIDESAAASEACAFIDWLRAERRGVRGEWIRRSSSRTPVGSP
jgi:hypothetical protein